MGFFDKIKKIGIFSGFSELNEEFYEELEEALILADAGMDTALETEELLRRRCEGGEDQGHGGCPCVYAAHLGPAGERG